VRALVLTYHSHHVAGPEYASNDHVALAVDLDVIDRAGFQIVPLTELVDRFLAAKDGAVDQDRVCALTFDDGPEYDAVDHHHPTLGMQPSFLRIMQEFAASAGGRRQPCVCATSFVIASPEARRCMEAATTSGLYYLHEGALNDDWWSGAIDSGRIAIANQSWDHLHPALAQVVHSRQAKGDFLQVDNERDADLQIDAATRYIDGRTGGRTAPFFTYPFGQYPPYLLDDYFPHGQNRAGASSSSRPARSSRICTTPPHCLQAAHCSGGSH
jgi:peptidoglycan/xylan/chitin deacetylase (PgdA/CDA1 family)